MEMTVITETIILAIINGNPISMSIARRRTKSHESSLMFACAFRGATDNSKIHFKRFPCELGTIFYHSGEQALIALLENRP